MLRGAFLKQIDKICRMSKDTVKPQWKEYMKIKIKNYNNKETFDTS